MDTNALSVTAEEHQHFKSLLAKQLGENADPVSEASYPSVLLQLHPKVLDWAKAEAEKRGIEYQVVINEVLLKQVG